MKAKYTEETFKEEIRKKFGGFYSTKDTHYLNRRTRIWFDCPKHGPNSDYPDWFLKIGCRKCAQEEKRKERTRRSLEKLVEQFREIHGDKYDYSDAEYTDIDTQIIISCRTCGKQFKQSPYEHRKGSGCPYCLGRYKTTEDVIGEAKKIHRDKYDYSKSEYINALTPMEIICTKHGKPYSFWQTYNTHVTGRHGCPLCSGRGKTTEIFIEEAKKIHGDKYDYSKSEYKGSKTPLIITCMKHGDFLQAPNSHLRGGGCPCCRSSHGEAAIENLLSEYGLKYIREHKFDDCLDIRKLPFDFYLPEYNTVIEFDGEQHFRPSNYGSKRDSPDKHLEYVKKHDMLKDEYCRDHGLKIFRLNYREDINGRLMEIISRL